MGLDLALGVVILLVAVRGWFQGFLMQAVRLTSLVACVFAADPVRDQMRPYVAPYLPGLGAGLLDRLLWWTACVLSYVVLVGLGTLLVRVYRRPSYGLPPETHRGDQGAGLMLGVAKGAVIVAFLAAGLERYALGHLEAIAWAEREARTSRVLRWSAQYQPVPQLLAVPAVQYFLTHVQRNGLLGDDDPADEEPPPPTASAPTASDRPRSLAVAPPEVPAEAELLDDDADLNRLRQELLQQMDALKALRDSR